MIEVKYIDHMGSDLSVVNAARVSFGKKSEWMPRIHYGEELVLKPKDAKLIRYLAKHQHKSPFNHTFVTFHVKAPVFVARQLVKHEYMPWNEISRRYVDDEPAFYVPDVWRGRSADKKQGSQGEVKTNANVEYHNNVMLQLYKQQLDEGVSPEQARIHLPQSMMTEWYWSGTLFSFSKMCGLRLKEDTQAETRIVAEQIDVVMQKIYPVSWDALKEYAHC
jgi:thymidylate synthase (FAD)